MMGGDVSVQRFFCKPSLYRLDYKLRLVKVKAANSTAVRAHGRLSKGVWGQRTSTYVYCS